MKKLLSLCLFLAACFGTSFAQSTTFTSLKGYTFDASSGNPRAYTIDTEGNQLAVPQGTTNAPSAPAGGVELSLPNDPLNPGSSLLLQYGTLTDYHVAFDPNQPVYPSTTGGGYSITYYVDGGPNFDANQNQYEAYFSGTVHFTFTGQWKFDTCGGRGLKHCPVYKEDEGNWNLYYVPTPPPLAPTSDSFVIFYGDPFFVADGNPWPQPTCPPTCFCNGHGASCPWFTPYTKTTDQFFNYNLQG